MLKVWLAVLVAMPFSANAQGIDCDAPSSSKQALGTMEALFKAQKERHTQRFARLQVTVDEKVRSANWSTQHKAQFFSQLIRTPQFQQLQKDIDDFGLPFNRALDDVDDIGKAGRFDDPMLCRRIVDAMMLSNQIDAAADRQVEYMASQVRAAD